MHERYGSELGFQLMKIESDILIAVITHLFKNGSKKAPETSGTFLFYLARPEPGPLGANVEPLGEALGPRVFADGP